MNHYYDLLGDSLIYHVLLAGYKSDDKRVINSFFIWILPGTGISKRVVKFQSVYHEAYQKFGHVSRPSQTKCSRAVSTLQILA